MGIFGNVFQSMAGRAAEQGPRRVEPREAWRLVREESAQLVDVRTPEEVRHKMAEGACCVPLQELHERLDELDRGRPVVVYCRSGGRSAAAADILARQGFRVFDAGGIGNLMR